MEYKFVCECGYRTKDRSNLNKHKKTPRHAKLMAGESTRKTYACECCEYTTQDKSNYNKHTKLHKEERTIHYQFECLACGRLMENKKQRDLHCRTDKHKRNVWSQYPETCVPLTTSLLFRINLSMKDVYIKEVDKTEVVNQKYDNTKARHKKEHNTVTKMSDDDLEEFGRTYYPDKTEEEYKEIVERLLATMEDKELNWIDYVSAVEEWEQGRATRENMEEMIVELLEAMNVEVQLLA